MTLLEAVEELMADEAFEECIYTEHGNAFWTIDSLYNALIEGDEEEDDAEYDISEKGHIHRLKDDGELGRKVYRNLGEPVKFFTWLAKDEAKDRGVEVDAAFLHQLSREVEIGIDDEIIEAVLKKCKPRKKK
jgi:hypothetical protein